MFSIFKTNTTDQGCSSAPDQASIPCFEPIVWTNGTYKNNQPDLNDLEHKCAMGQTLEHTICVPFCTKNEDPCIKMTYYNREICVHGDRDNNPFYSIHTTGCRNGVVPFLLH